MSFHPYFQDEHHRDRNNFDGLTAPGTKGNPLPLTVPTKARAKEIQKQLDEHGWVGDITVDSKAEEDTKALEVLLTPVKPFHAEETPGRNDPCPCGSGKKYKHCHGSTHPPAEGKKTASTTAQKKTVAKTATTRKTAPKPGTTKKADDTRTKPAAKKTAAKTTAKKK